MVTDTTNIMYRVDTFRPGHIELTGWPNSAATPDTPNVESVTLSPLHKGFEVGSWRLRSLLLTEVHVTQNSVVALTYLSGASEYGSGQTPEEALRDLVVSLGEYRQTLEVRRDRLGESTRRDLEVLEGQVEPATPG